MVQREQEKQHAPDIDLLMGLLHEPALLVDASLRVTALNEPARVRLGEVAGREVAAIPWPVGWESLPALLAGGDFPAEGPVRVLDLGGLRLVLLAPDTLAPERLRRLLLENRKHTALSAIASGAAHEINNPLGGIVQSVQLIQRALDLDSPRTRERLKEAEIGEAQLEIVGRYLENRRLDKFAGIIQEASGRLTDLVGHVLGFARRSDAEPRRHSLAALVEQALFLASVDNDMRKHYQFRDIALNRASDIDRVDVDVEPNALLLVLVESLKLAAAACAARRNAEGEGYRPAIAFDLFRDESEWRLSIRDNGQPLSQETLAVQHLAPEQAHHDEKGFVLSVCRELVNSANGTGFWVDSREHGNGFTVGLKAI